MAFETFVYRAASPIDEEHEFDCDFTGWLEDTSVKYLDSDFTKSSLLAIVRLGYVEKKNSPTFRVTFSGIPVADTIPRISTHLDTVKENSSWHLRCHKLALCHSIKRGVSVSWRTDEHEVLRSCARVNDVACVWYLREDKSSLSSIQNIPQELTLLFYMENKGFHVEKQDSYELKDSPRNGNEIVAACPCEESQTNCSCREPKEAKPQIKVLSWTSSKGWILLAVGFCFAIWMAVFFTLFAFRMV
ncbi:uncharacterized protein LOC119584722 [Penaeus monodon]|uniref:uncharacterized protein LOC119584722 n=1 Tax=Penaeus monodon TaxID=6687 RepID=UPI0018A78B0B|nr:uncharacterized protein LOC119584722 [Penaeus monodon]